jgi:hypothetical protein
MIGFAELLLPVLQARDLRGLPSGASGESAPAQAGGLAELAQPVGELQ